MSDSTAALSPRRTNRDWLVDTGLFLAAAVYGVVTAAARLDVPTSPDWVFALDQATGALGCAALWLRRRWPVQLALVLVVLSAFSELVAGAMLVALFTVAVHRPPRVTLAVFLLSALSASVYVWLRPEPGTPSVLLFLLGLAVQGAAAGWGLSIHNRRQLVLSLRDRAARAETEAKLRAEQAQQQTRQAIARDIHDVLGHRLSLLSVHAGALEYNPEASPEQIRQAAQIIRESAHQALQDLRDVIGVLRAPTGELPQPGLSGVHELAGDSAEAGMWVDVHEDVTGAVPGRTGQIAYRIVQEALTNARKHAPGAGVRVKLAGEPGAGLTVDIANGSATEPVTLGEGEGSGQGLLGLGERISLAGGRLDHGPTDEGGWRLTAWLPWLP